MHPKTMEERLSGLGSSDAAAIVGLSKYATPHDIYNQKRGLAAPTPDSDAMAFGKLMEPLLIQRYWDKHPDLHVRENLHPADRDRQEVFSHSEEDWIKATPDGFAYDPQTNARWLIEAKTASWRMADQWGQPGTDEVPDHYLIQCAWQMLALELDRVDIIALLDRSFETYTIRRDAKLEKQLRQRCSDFWHNHILAGEPPAADSSAACTQRLALLHDRKTKEMLEPEAGSMLFERILALQAATTEARYHEDAAKRLKNEIAEILGPDKKGARTELGTVTWVHRKPSEKKDWQAIALAAGASEELIAAHTTTSAGSSYLTARFKKGASKTS